ncbi:MAG: hypothetical protein HFE83_09060 [Lachnospiraceae bacterium]|nr:hypothetical protein [Lachnospiraceae bacterium]
MIRISKINDELTVYRGKEIILFGAGRNGIRIKRELERKGFKISYFCDNNEKIWGEGLDHIEIISPSRLRQIYDCEKTLIQISSTFSRSIEEQLVSYKIEAFISFDEYCERMHALSIYKTLPQSLEAYQDLYFEPGYEALAIRKRCVDYAVRVNYFDLDSYQIICLPPKTGNYTLEASLQKHHAEYVRISPCYDLMSAEAGRMMEGKKIKIVTAVRDPVAQNLSFFFQINTRYCDIPEYWRDGGDVQLLWDEWISHVLGNELQFHRKSSAGRRHIKFSYMEYMNQLYHNVIAMQDFFEKNFQPYNGIDVYACPFDKEKGYSVIQSGNREVFIYQLEKLDMVKKELGEFLGIEDFELTKDNVGEKKWYAPAYKQALEELKLSKEYVEACYRTRLVRHFYSEVDIQKFRQKWSKNVEE